MYRIVKTVMLLSLACLLFPREASAQRVSVSTDLLEFASLSPNVSVQFTPGRHSTFAVGVTGSPWRVSPGVYYRHLGVAAEYRHWLGISMSGHSVSARLRYSSFDLCFGGDRTRRTGDSVSAVAVYGWSKVLTPRINLRPHAGAGVGYAFCRTGRGGLYPVVDVGLDLEMILK